MENQPLKQPSIPTPPTNYLDDDAAFEEMRQEYLAANKDNRIVTADVTNVSGVGFDDFFLKRELLLGIYAQGYEKCSPVQEAAIPVALAGNDLLARAKNGTGKTAAYAIPILQKIDIHNNHIQALVLAPARELAMQTSSVIRGLGRFMEETNQDDAGNTVVTSVNCMVTTGGTTLRDDILRLNKPVHILVGTLGRLIDLTSKDIAKLEHCKTVVLDEADKMLSDELIGQVEQMLGYCPKDRQVMLYSATFPRTVSMFKERHIPKAKEINLMTELTLKGVTQFYAYVEERQKLHCLNTLFQKLNISQCIIFCSSVKRVELLSEKITALGFPCFFIHSGMQQTDRNRVFHDFRQGNIKCLVSSDLFARGIDVAGVNVVINFDFPKNSETYLHRIGRSGRFGHLGIAVNLLCYGDRPNLYRIENELSTTIEPIPSKVDDALYT